MTQQTIVLKCPVCGHFIAEIGNFVRARCCGYEIIISNLRDEALTRSPRTPTITPTS